MPNFLICYDICAQKRLLRCHRYLSNHAYAVQKSLFLLFENPRKLSKMEKALLHIIHHQQDDLRIYQFNHFEAHFGQSILPLDFFCFNIEKHNQHSKKKEKFHEKNH